MADLATDLRDPEAYPARPARVDLVETHISWVFLAGGEVFKVKKPVDFGFLDFTTLAQRQRACEAEVRLNARLAPRVYLGVVPVRRDERGRHRLDGEGTIVDWAVRMQRLPDEDRGDQLLARGALGPAQIDLLAERLAAFHAGAQSDQAVAALGEPPAIAINVRENFAQTRADIARYLTPDEAGEVEAWQLGLLSGRAELFWARVRARRIRDGHGDLRLEQLYVRPDGEVTILDCIEFNDRFRCGDVCADVAFLAMDLAWRGRVDLAELLLARYARHADDYDLYSVVDFYESYRAWVRGKVCNFLLRDPNASTALRERAELEARRYFLLALSADRRPLLVPRVVAVGGIIASGKSTIADLLGERLSAPVIDSDRTRKGMLHVAPTERVADSAWSGAYDPRFTERVYDEVLRRARVVLESGRPVIIDASFRSVATRRQARALAEAHGVPFHLVECVADAALCRERLAARAEGPAVSDGRLDVFDDFCARYEAVSELPAAEHVRLDTGRPLEESLRRLDEHIERWPRGLAA